LCLTLLFEAARASESGNAFAIIAEEIGDILSSTQ